MAVIDASRAGGTNIIAALDTIAFTEGTDITRQPTRDHGYDVLVGGALFSDYSKHPNVLVKLNAKLSSTAAGRYQILYRYWEHYRKSLNLPDFGPLSQDLYAINQIRERGAIKLFQAGDIEAAFAKISNIWASLPGAGYGQHEYSFDTVKAIYVMKGGTYAGN